MDKSKILQTAAFANLSQEKQAALQGFLAKIDGVSMAEAMPYILEFIKSNESSPNKITKQEQAEMLEAVLTNLPPQDQEKFSAVLKMMKLRQ
ncbi:MAG: hypothetical protein LBS62_10805 [Clostridiales bacterium]|jgi:hypothetical protein|nr:hypothetical protein [Clostridiales bacterium]